MKALLPPTAIRDREQKIQDQRKKLFTLSSLLAFYHRLWIQNILPLGNSRLQFMQCFAYGFHLLSSHGWFSIFDFIFLILIRKAFSCSSSLRIKSIFFFKLKPKLLCTVHNVLCTERSPYILMCNQTNDVKILQMSKCSLFSRSRNK